MKDYLLSHASGDLFLFIIGLIACFWFAFRMYIITMKSAAVTLRASLRVEIIYAAAMFLIALVLDAIANEWAPFITNGIIKDLYSPIALAAVLGVFAWFLLNSPRLEVLIPVLFAIVFVKIIGGDENYIGFAIMVSTVVVYGVIIIKNTLLPASKQMLFLLILTLAITVIAFLANRYLWNGENYLSFTALLYTMFMFIKYFWILEFKRRRPCGACGGGGIVGNRPKATYWWAVGSLQFNSKSGCPKCEGRGWVHIQELLHQ